MSSHAPSRSLSLIFRSRYLLACPLPPFCLSSLAFSPPLPHIHNSKSAPPPLLCRLPPLSRLSFLPCSLAPLLPIKIHDTKSAPSPPHTRTSSILNPPPPFSKFSILNLTPPFSPPTLFLFPAKASRQSQSPVSPVPYRDIRGELGFQVEVGDKQTNTDSFLQVWCQSGSRLDLEFALDRNKIEVGYGPKTVASLTSNALDRILHLVSAYR